MAIVYLENDDEITSAIARIRAVRDGDAIVVVPPGSRIATSRINFKLLAREAAERRVNMVAVSDEPQVRALAISAGLPAYDSIPTAEQALATFREQDRRLAKRIDRTMPREHPATGPASGSGETMVLPTATASTTSARDSKERVPIDTAVLPAQQAAAARRPRQKRRIALAPLLVLGLVVLLIAGVVYGAYVFLPTATITLRPASTRIAAPQFSVTADPSVAVVDATSGIIPAQQVSVPVHVEATFNATGIDAHDTRAAGSVRFKSENTVGDVAIPANTVVSTADGTDFVTQADIVVPKASFATGPTQIDVAVRAVKGGTKGNVDAGTVTVLPPDLAAKVVSVTNPDQITGGKHVEDQIVIQQDYDAALSSLSGELQAALQQTLAEPQSVQRGLTAFPDTAQMSAGQPDQPASSVVGVIEPTFTLGLDATAIVTAVNETLIDQVAAARVRGALPSGQKLVGDGVTVVHDNGMVVDQTVVYNVTASGAGYADPDPQALISAVRGKSIADAQAALASFGTVTISVWPDFVDHLPDQSARISVTVVAPSAAAIPTPANSATPVSTANPVSTSPAAS